MPPANTPTAASAERSPVRPQTPAILRSLTPLSYLSSPAPNLASTLITSQAADEADEANVTFLRDSLESLEQAAHEPRRSHVDAQRDPRRLTDAPAHEDPSPERRETPEDLSRRERLQRVLARLNRIYEPSASSTAAYSNRTPSPNRQSLYDWAPSYEDGRAIENELDAVLAEMRRQQPDTHPQLLSAVREGQLASQRQQVEDGEHMPAANPNETSAERRERRRDQRERRRRDTDWVSLRSRLQRAREDGAGSPSATAGMLRYVMDRERSGISEEEERARGAGWFRPSPSRPGNEESRNRDPSFSNHRPLPSSSSDSRERERQERLEAFRRGYLAENASSRLPREATPPIPQTSNNGGPANPTGYLEDTLKYLSAMRFRSPHDKGAGERARKMYVARQNDEDAAITSFPDLSPLPHSSWLQPGSVFEGHQRATPINGNLTRSDLRSIMRIDQINPNYRATTGAATGFDHPPGSTRVTPFDDRWHLREPYQNPSTSTSVVKRSEASKNHWPVRVIIHAVDKDKMGVQGTMEAYDVPQHPAALGDLHIHGHPKTAGKKHAPITTYLEGHIIDFRTHSLITPGAEDYTPKTGPYATSPMNSTPYTTIDDSIEFPSANIHTDAQNWLRLPPFCDISASSASSSTRASSPEDQVADLLLSPDRLNTLNQEYIFMRWKERCFVHGKNDVCTASGNVRSGDRDRGHGLTISGFYYISLRRSDGRVEGLYFDPTSTPYQHLRLDGTRGGWGAWSFK